MEGKCFNMKITSDEYHKMIDAIQENFNTSIEQLKDLVITTSYTEMATVARNDEHNYLIVVTPDTSRSDAYIKVCNNKSYSSCTEVIRLAFKEVRYFEHKGDGKSLWKMDLKLRKELIKFLGSKPKLKERRGNFDTNWELAIFLWNNECGFTDDEDYDESFPEGCNPKSELYKNPQYVPLNTPIPDYTKIKFK